MIQRIQSVWLLLAAIFAAITFSVPFYVGTPLSADIAPQLTAKSNMLLIVLTVLTGLTAFASIFLFENRKLQLKVAVAGLVLTLALLTDYILQLKYFTAGAFALSCVLHFGILGLYILAIRGIRKDQKLIKSLDRLR
ncbi:DUF4293 domain-containing protein [Flavisolibacter ginsenosidimutans]|uniref:DUF4293 family protein n=1 Tax=Flavisolibacter ginsenosidimutans TaxID=661481 RepID=A0A5B8UP74_9BACT|nr:DUF4293 domain-containing protein [Flavisolibacter ginsenosidimutans]QEC57840.1 DUF4293 family protein [Flavisolibacter ginsenosidimutans]